LRQNDQEIENDEDQHERDERQERTGSGTRTPSTEQLSHYNRLHDHTNSSSTGLAGCGKTLSAQQAFNGLDILEKNKILPQDAQKARPTSRET
jgi:hypothetical protein